MKGVRTEGTLTKLDYFSVAFVFLFTLVFYIMTTAPTVTFWDAGEFIATSYSLGIPHPPGTPLFVLIGRVWTLLIPFGSVAFKMNLFSVACGVTSAALLYLIVSRILRAWVDDDDDRSARMVVHGGGISAAIVSSYLITIWESTTETEVYTLALLTISLFTWLMFRWGDNLSWNKRTNLIVLMGFIAGLSVGNHLMALLIGPSLILFIFMSDWRSLINTKTLLAVVVFFLLALTVHIYLPVRASLDPSINEADPSTWQALWEVLARKQYGSRSMFVRTADFFRYQIPLYFIYFRDQFGSELLMWPLSAIGVWGMVEHFRRERKSFYFLFLLFLFTSLGLVIYLNFRIGHTQALNEVPDPQMHEVRERDYFFIVSFVVFGLWIGMGLASIFNVIRKNLSQKFRENGCFLYSLALIVFLPSLIPLYMNYDRADRSGNYIAYDYAYNILQSVEPYGLIFTNGDNDTFPLWFLQEVVGLRKDVIVANLSLLNTPWYIKQIRDRELPRPEELSPETREFFEEKERYDLSELYMDTPVVSMIDDRVDALFPRRIPRSYHFKAGGLSHNYSRGRVFYVKDIMVLHILEVNNWKRPIYFAVTVSDNNKVDLHDNLVMEGLVYRFNEQRSDSLARIRPEIEFIPETGTYINMDRSKHLLNDIYSYRGIFDDTIFKSRNTKKLLNNYAAAYSYLGRSLLGRNELDSAIECYESAYRFASSNNRFLYLLATLYAQSGQGEKADDNFRRFVEDRPLDSRYLLQMASFFIRGDDSTRAVNYLEEAIIEDPDMKEGYQMLGQIYDKGEEKDKADEIRRKWLVSHPGDSLN